ncbi:MAG: hypothetical protein PVF58_02130 [Candidatus Methanofastidiosia archaeon]
MVNFDIALYSTYYNTICLIECKSNLRKRLVSTVNELQEKIDFIEKNNAVDVDRKNIKIKDYFGEKLHTKDPNFYYILASEIVDLGTSFDDIVQISKHPFGIWQCQWCKPDFSGIKITRKSIPSYDDKEKHISIKELTYYLSKIHSSAGNTIQICLSSNKYYIAFQSCINLKSFESFTFDDFLTSFSIDLKEYEEFEKKYLFEQFINFGIECSFLKILEDTKDIFTSSYAIINRRMKLAQLKKNIITKMANQKVESDPEIRKTIEEEKQNIIQEIFYQREPKQIRLTEFTDRDK